MFKFFDYIVSLISAVIDMVVSTISMIVFALQFIVKGVAYAFTLINMLPPFVIVPVYAIIAYTVIITIIHFGD